MPHYEEIPLGSPRDRLQSEIDEVVVIMKDNATRVMERGASIATMDERASQLIEGSRAFERTSRRTKRQMMWENMKQNCRIISVIAIVLTCLIIYIWINTRHLRHATNYTDNAKHHQHHNNQTLLI